MIEAEFTAGTLNYDSDDDLDVDRNREGVILIGIGLIIMYFYVINISELYLQNIAYLQSSVWSVCKCGEPLSC